MEKCVIYRGELSPRKHKGDAGLDIISNMDTTIPVGSRAIITTGLVVGIPYGKVGFVKGKSGLSFNHDIEVGAGVIDHLYRDEIKVKLYNFGDKEFNITKGMKIAQLVTLNICLDDYDTRVGEIEDTSRGTDGFGSTGSHHEE